MKKFLQSICFLSAFINIGFFVNLSESYKVNDKDAYNSRILEFKQEHNQDAPSGVDDLSSGDDDKETYDNNKGVSLFKNELFSGAHSNADSLYMDGYSIKDFPSNDITSGVKCFRVAYEVDFRGRFNHETYSNYCANHCVFSDTILCDIPSLSFTGGDSDFLGKIYKDALDKNTAHFDLIYTDSEAFNGLIDFISFLLPLIGLLVPINLNEMGYKVWARVVILFFLIMSMIYFECDSLSTAGMMFFIVTMAFVAPNSNLQQRSNISISTLVAFAIISFKYDNVYLDIVMWVLVILSYGVMIYHSAMAKNGLEHSFIFINVVVFLMSMRCFFLLLVKREHIGTFISLVNFSFSTIMPYGAHSSYWRNNLEASAALASRLSYLGVKLSGHTIFIGLAGIGLILSLLYRSLAGVAMVSSLHVKLPLSAVSIGLYIYAIDIFGGLRVFFGMIFGHYKWSHRRTLYVIFNLTTLIFEFYYGTEILMLRFFLFVLDITIIDSGYLFVAKYLTTNLNFGGMAFPKAQSLPWFDTTGLNSIIDSVVKLTVTKPSGCVKGVGFIRCDGHGNADLLTVKHVIEDRSAPVSFSFGKHSSNDSSTTQAGSRTMSEGGDPVVAMSVQNQNHPNVQLLAKNEIRNVKALFCVHDEGAMNFINEYSFKPDGDISAHINLRSGDSGSPVFSVMNDGSFRYCGAVSKGSFDSGSGNFISSVGLDYRVGSPGGDNRAMDVVSEHLDRDAMYGRLHELLVENKDFLDANFNEPSAPKGKKRLNRKRVGFKTRAQELLNVIGSDSFTDKYLKLLSDGEIVDFNTLRATVAYNGRFVRAMGG